MFIDTIEGHFQFVLAIHCKICHKETTLHIGDFLYVQKSHYEVV